MFDQDNESPDQDSEQLLDLRELYSHLMTRCLESEADPVDVLVALTLVLRDLALKHHGPDVARTRSVDALDHSFVLDCPIWPHETLH
jgi:hypothetical protein